MELNPSAAPRAEAKKKVLTVLLLNTRIIFDSDKLYRIWVMWQHGWGKTKGQD